ncbi:MAG: molybdopterin-binding/glycosyltransferase family 2 protein [Pseudomonadota bacterium]
MKFGPVPLAQAEGGVLAHSLSYPRLTLRKGTVLEAHHVSALSALGVEDVTIARMEPGDLPENEAAGKIAAALVPDPDAQNLRLDAPFTGRCNVFATQSGVFDVDAVAITALNSVDPAITLATLPPMTRVAEGDMLVTLKIIPYGVSGACVERALSGLKGQVMSVSPPKITRAALILTRTPGMKDSLIDKGAAAVKGRLAGLGVALNPVRVVPHETQAVADILAEIDAPLTLVLGGSATSDENDVGPAALSLAGGVVHRFGMPVDPGNLLFLGEMRGAPVIGLPGCARSPALNGADWVLERLVCGIPVEAGDIAAMGVGGLLKEIPTRPQPRAFALEPRADIPKVSVLLLAAGQSRRMKGEDKLTKQVDGQPLVRRQTQRALASLAQDVLVVLPPDRPERDQSVADLPARKVTALCAREGMAASLNAGLAEVAEGTDAVLILLGDMPDVDTALIDRLIQGYRPGEQADILRPVTPAGKPGHPVLFGKRFFDALSELTGDQGARELVRQAAEFVRDIPVSDESPTVDLDTPEAWAQYLEQAEKTAIES